MYPFVLYGAEHAERRVASARVVPGLDVLDDRVGQVLPGRLEAAVGWLELQGAEEGLDHGVVEAVADRARLAERPGLAQLFADGPARVLRPVSGVRHRLPGFRVAAPAGHIKRVADKLGA